MKIAIIAPAWFAVPPSGYGGIEWVVALLADGLVDAGHEVTLFAAGDSRTKAKLVSVYGDAPSALIGRTRPDKGAHRAIAVAMETGLPLKIAGKRQDPKEFTYFHELVEPHLVDGIEYLGEVSHGEKVELLQNARATLFPIEWEEPFGLVMIESMACGTPVIATRRGAVPEVIEQGRSGIIVDDYRIMPLALEEADRIDPMECRRYVEERFAPERMVADYVKAYRRAIERARPPVPVLYE